MKIVSQDNIKIIQELVVAFRVPLAGFKKEIKLSSANNVYVGSTLPPKLGVRSVGTCRKIPL